jgi:hypothetical protein
MRAEADGSTMTDDKHIDEGRTGAPAKAPAPNQTQNPRADRLKLALRENLKRRKSQARERSGVTIAPSNEEEVSLDEASGKKPGE